MDEKKNSGKKYSAALIGCGRIGFTLGFDRKREQPASHTMAMMKNPRIELAAGVDSDAEKLGPWKKFVGNASSFLDSEELYASFIPDIIDVAVNESSHKSESLRAISAGPKLLVLEKPVALNLDEALEIKEAADKAGVSILINHERRFAEDYILAKKAMDSIGDIQSIRARLSSGLVVYRKEAESTGGYSLFHDGTHLVDAVLFFLEDDGRPSQVGDDRKNTILHDPVLTGVFRDEKGDVRQLEAHYCTEKCPDVTVSISGRSKFFAFEIEITGTTGRICLGNGYFKVYRRKESRLYTGFYSLAKDRGLKAPKKTRYFSNMIRNAVDFLDGKAELRSTIQTGINALAVLEEIKHNLIKSE